MWVGLGLVATGAGLLGYVGWQFWGTNWVAHREQDEVTAALRSDWSNAGSGLEPKRVAPGKASGLEPKRVAPGKASALIRIPRFGSAYVVPVLEGVAPDVLARGFGHFMESSDPGQAGNYALAAHRVTHGEPLRRMPELRPGDSVIVETAGATYSYRLDTDPDRLVIPSTGVWVLDPVPKNPEAGGPQPAQRAGQKLITLTTCSEIFHTDDRMVAFGHLVKAIEKHG